jgi:hypothetical protein
MITLCLLKTAVNKQLITSFSGMRRESPTRVGFVLPAQNAG